MNGSKLAGDSPVEPMRQRPDFSWEHRHGAAGPVAGIDEAGRGPLAGPVVAAAVILDPHRVPAGIDDSKKLSAAARARLARAIAATATLGIGAASVGEIDAQNILAASLLAMTRAVRRLPVRPGLVLVDGNRAPRLACPCLTIVGGDATSLSIAAASIIAKVTRDRIMDRLARRWPLYGFESHKGYPTPHHRAALIRHGATPHHRLSFAGVHNI